MLRRAVAVISICVIAVSVVVLLNDFCAVKKLEPQPTEIMTTTPYQDGYIQGYYSFLRQSGYDVQPPKTVKYANTTDDHAEPTADEEAEIMRGYIDGYHRAGKLGQCTRNQ